MTGREPTDARWFRDVLGHYPTGVSVVTATQPDGTRAGFVVGSFTSVSLDPPLVAFFPGKTSTSWPKIRNAGQFCVNILGADQEHLCRRFASRAQDKFSGLECDTAASGSPVLPGVVAWIDCDLESVTEAGDHFIVVGRVRELDRDARGLPLLFFQGGYGRFTPHSPVTAERGGQSTGHFRNADLVRDEMEDLAWSLSARCIAASMVSGEL